MSWKTKSGKALTAAASAAVSEVVTVTVTSNQSVQQDKMNSVHEILKQISLMYQIVMLDC